MIHFYEKEHFLIKMISKQLDANELKNELYSSRNIRMKMFKYHYLDYVDTFEFDNFNIEMLVNNTSFKVEE
jgi:hypothetical protein